MADLRPNSEIADGIHWLKDRHVNIYVVEKGDNLILIDSGMNKKAKVIEGYLKTELEHRKVEKILLTHHHMDHTGGLFHMQQYFHPTIYSSEIDGQVISGERKAPKPNSIFLKPLLYILTPFLKLKPIMGIQYVAEGESVDDFSVFAFPGHTMGSLGFLKDNIMFGGDNAITNNNMVNHGNKTFAESIEDNYRSLKKLSRMNFDMLLSGHGTPILEDADQRALAAVERLNI